MGKRLLLAVNSRIMEPTPFGPVVIIWDVRGDRPKVVRVFITNPQVSAGKRAAEAFPEARAASCDEIEAVVSAIKGVLEGEACEIPIGIAYLDQCTPFQRQVLEAVYRVPRGRVATYGGIAQHLGIAGGARAVGNVMAKNPFPIIIPCHRIIRCNGHIGGYGGGPEMKRRLLQREGVRFDNAGRVARESRLVSGM